MEGGNEVEGEDPEVLLLSMKLQTLTAIGADQAFIILFFLKSEASTFKFAETLFLCCQSLFKISEGQLHDHASCF